MKVRRGSFYDEIMFETLKIEIMTPGDSEVGIGTGFLLSRKADDGGHYMFLVSNKHVFSDPNKKIRLTFHKRKGPLTKPLPEDEPLLGTTITVGPTSFSSIYYEHPDHNIDLACILLGPILNSIPDIYYINAPMDMLATYDEPDLAAGKQVLFVGYPDNRYDQLNNLPLVRSGILATYPLADFNGLPQVVIDAQVFGGSSGSPVYMFVGDQWRLIGVVAQTMIKDQKLVTVDATPEQRSRHILGLGIVYKSTALREMIEHAVWTLETSLMNVQ